MTTHYTVVFTLLLLSQVAGVPVSLTSSNAMRVSLHSICLLFVDFAVSLQNKHQTTQQHRHPHRSQSRQTRPITSSPNPKPCSPLQMMSSLTVSFRPSKAAFHPWVHFSVNRIVESVHLKICAQKEFRPAQ
jgi:hypothetical protein